MGHEKGSDTESRIKHNFGMAKPEGYRKAVRLMDLADRFNIPVIALVDTAGAYPGIGAEERGQAEAIARSTDRCLSLGVPMIAVVIGEGGSGGAVAIATANKVLMLEHAVYTVASPEAAASILWRDSGKANDAANNMKITAQDLAQLGVIDRIVPEPTGGAHRDRFGMIQRTGDAIAEATRGVRRQGRQPSSAASGRTSSSPSAEWFEDGGVAGAGILEFSQRFPSNVMAACASRAGRPTASAARLALPGNRLGTVSMN